MKYYILYPLIIAGLLCASCTDNLSNDSPSATQSTDHTSIELTFDVEHFTNKVGLRSGGDTFSDNGWATLRTITDAGSAKEQEIKSLYLLMFDGTGQNPYRYHITSATFTGGSYDSTAKKIKLNRSQTEAGTRRVYLVANVDTATKNALDGITTESAFKAHYKEIAQPWANNITAPLLMVGYKEHNFAATPAAFRLDHIKLVRAVAKIELNIKLSEPFQVAPTEKNGVLNDHKFRYVNFDKRTYLIKPTNKPLTPASSAAEEWPNVTKWTGWGNTLGTGDTGTSYTLTSNGKVSNLRIITYINEQDQERAKIEIALPRVDLVPLPPPEFGPEKYILPLPQKVERNKWYKYDIEI